MSLFGHSSTGLSRGSNLSSTLGARSSCSASSTRTSRKLGRVMDMLGKMKDGVAMGSSENRMDRVKLRWGGVLGEAAMVEPVRDDTG